MTGREQKIHPLRSACRDPTMRLDGLYEVRPIPGEPYRGLQRARGGRAGEEGSRAPCKARFSAQGQIEDRDQHE